jgi:hypothetical protein
MSKSKYYYETDRNKDSKDYQTNATPAYYIGKKYNYKVKDIIYDFDLSYNLGTAISYILRSGRKLEMGLSVDDKAIEDLYKAINHLRFEIENKSEGGL